ncbi:MAG: phosphate ABC transporter permease subunit PstC [Solirubrobacteraceae bacterium]|nr:phosphate ABC transporter permease subunit PstC [Patulibacter sp.]
MARPRLRISDRVGDRLLLSATGLASAIAVLLLVLIAWQVFKGSGTAFHKFGFGFLTGTTWKPNFNQYGAGTLLFGTFVTGVFALFLAAPIGIAIGLYLSLMAPPRVRAIIGPVVEMLAAIPSVIIGFWGILVLAPFLVKHAEPQLHSTVGFIPLFGLPQTNGASMFAAGLILTIMVIPIVASISRDLFDTVPRELQEGASALGATRWEMIRGVMLPTTASGLAATSFLGLGRALGEAIAVTQVIGAGTKINTSLYETGDTLASRLANQFQNATDQLQTSSLFYLGALLLIIGLGSNLLAQWIGRRFAVQKAHA